MDQLPSDVADLALFLILALLVTYAAQRLGFYSMPESDQISRRHTISDVDVCKIFAFYLTMQMLIVPVASYFWLSYRAGLWLTAPVAIDSAAGIWLGDIAILAVAAFLWLYSRVTMPMSLKSAIGLQSCWSQLPSGIGGCFVSYPMVLFTGQLLGILVNDIGGIAPVEQIPVQSVKLAADDPQLFALTAVAVIVVAPWLEELLFRGFLQSWLRSAIGAKSAIAVSSLIFASFHFSMSLGFNNLEILGSLFLLSCYLGFLYERQNSLWAPIVLHSTFNGINVALLTLKGSP